MNNESTQYTDVANFCYLYTIDAQPDCFMGCELIDRIFESYFIVSTHECKKWLQDNHIDIINEVSKYHNFHFGSCRLDFTDHFGIANTYARMLGEQFLSELNHLKECWSNILSERDLLLISNEMHDLL